MKFLRVPEILSSILEYRNILIWPLSDVVAQGAEILRTTLNSVQTLSIYAVL